MKSPTLKKSFRHSRELRRGAADAEMKFWHRVRRRQLRGAKFRRQHPIGGFIVDFYCHEAKLAIELDGGGHAELDRADYDSERSLELEGAGIKVLRFWNNEVLENIDGVLEVVSMALTPALSRREREKSKDRSQEAE